MREEIVKRARELLESKKAGVVIGYGEGSQDHIHAIFVTDPADAGKLVIDDRCDRNLAVYLMKPEVRDFGKIAIIALPHVMRSIVQLVSEHQIRQEDITVIGITPEQTVREFADFGELADYVASIPIYISPEDRKMIDRIDAMTPRERWDFWMKEISMCVKCYACRASCPLCYCTRCTVECNQPQWIHVPAHELGNLEWHIMRAMHLAGRCTNCGECARSCPLDIPLHLLTIRLAEEIEREFGVRAGTKHDEEYALATFKPGDRENFIR